MNEEAVDNAVLVLNRLHKADPSVMQSLVYTRVRCNQAVADDPTIQVRERVYPSGKAWEVGILGIINGLFGVDEHDVGYIVAELDKSGQILYFKRKKS